MSAEFVACMEDVLDLYAEPYDPERPVVCFDETSKQLLAEKRSPIPPKPARRERYDYEYQRNGTRNLFMLCEPLAGWRHVAVTERRTMVDFAQQMRWLADEAYPASEKIRVVLDNLNTHKPASLYETFEPKEARRIRKRLEFHYTPKHGRWLLASSLEGFCQFVGRKRFEVGLVYLLPILLSSINRSGDSRDVTVRIHRYASAPRQSFPT